MTPHFVPEAEAKLADAIAGAYADKMSLEVIGSGSLTRLGRPVAACGTLSTTALADVVDYQPEESMITVRPGTPMDVLAEVLAERGQQLAFEPPQLAGLWGAPLPGTIGGVIGANLSGPRRFRAGAARDHILAVRAVGGRGEMFKAGGKVVKNVTGYDLAKLLTGSFGTFAVLSEITLKVLPRAPYQLTLLVYDKPVDEALTTLRDLAGDPREPTALSFLATGERHCLAVRLEGSVASVRERAQALAGILSGADMIEAEQSMAFWIDVRDVHPHLGADVDAMLWRVSVPPSAAAAVLNAAQPKGFVVDHAGGTLWLDRPVEGWEPNAGEMGAMLVRGPDAIRHARSTVMSTPETSRLVERLRAQFDPAGILNPGRLESLAV